MLVSHLSGDSPPPFILDSSQDEPIRARETGYT